MRLYTEYIPNKNKLINQQQYHSDLQDLLHQWILQLLQLDVLPLSNRKYQSFRCHPKSVGEYLIVVRAIDSLGNSQPLTSRRNQVSRAMIFVQNSLNEENLHSNYRLGFTIQSAKSRRKSKLHTEVCFFALYKQ